MKPSKLLWSNVDAICGLSLLLVLSFAPRGFSPGTSVFPSPQKPAFPNSNSTRNQVDEEPLCGCATSKSLLIYLFYLSISEVKNAWWAEATHTIWKKSCYQKYNSRKSPLLIETKQQGRKRNMAFCDTMLTLSVYYKRSFDEKVETHTKPITTLPNV